MSSTCDLGDVLVGQVPVLLMRGCCGRTWSSSSDMGDVPVEHSPELGM